VTGYYGRDGQPITREAWIASFEDEDAKRIADDKVGDAWVSTVWLGLDHNFLGNGPPIIFETMVFGGKYDQEQERYSTEAAALAGHAWIVAMVTQ
jgi:hypothetical protein